MEFLLEKKSAHTIVSPKCGAQKDGCVRVYAESPETAALQIRTNGPIAASGRGVRRLAFSHVSLTADDIAKLIAELTEQRARLLQRAGV